MNEFKNMSLTDIDKYLEDVYEYKPKEKFNSYKEKYSSDDIKVSNKKHNIIHLYGNIADNPIYPKAFTYVDWGKIIMYDLRKWETDYIKPYRGISFNSVEIKELKKIVNNINMNKKYISYHTVTSPHNNAKIMIYERLGIISNTAKGKKMIHLAKWPKSEIGFDIRLWYHNGNFGKGIHLSYSEMKKFIKLVNEYVQDFDLPDLDSSFN